MAGFKNSSNDDYGPVAEINITPLVDVMLVLLIIFMVTAPLLENGIAVQLPKASAKALPKDEAPVTLNITQDHRFYLNRDALLPTELSNKLRIIFKNRSRKEIFVRADSAIPYGFVAQTMAAIKLAGITKIGLVTLPPDSKEAAAVK